MVTHDPRAAEHAKIIINLQKGELSPDATLSDR
jgi:ABC-type lipoprotein export system ATPase subunit